MIASIGAFGFGLTQLLFLYTVIKVHPRGRKRLPRRFGMAPRGWSGRCRRRRRTTRSKRRRWS